MFSWSSRQRKKRCDFFFIVWLEEFLFHCLEYSNEIELKRQQIRKKKQQQQNKEISINEERKLRIKSRISYCNYCCRQKKNAVMNFLTHLKVSVIYYQCRRCLSSLLF